MSTGSGFPARVDGVMPRWSGWVESRPALDFVDYNLRGVGQVVFMNNPVTGLLILVALWVTSAWLGFAALLGLVASTATALALGFDRAAVRAGLFGFNGVLTGCGLAVFLEGEFTPSAIVYVVATAAVSTVVTAALTRLLLPTLGVPALTLPFNVATLAFLLAAFGFGTGDLDPAAIEPRLPAVGDEIDRALRGEEGTASGAVGTATAVLGALFRGVAQVFLSGSAAAGVLIVAGMAVCSRIAATAAVLGSLTGLLTGLAVGADGLGVHQGLWGYNSVLSAVAIAGMSYVLTWSSALLAAACAVTTAVALPAVGTLLAPFGLPAFTLPFCLVTLTFLLVGGASSRLLPVRVEQAGTPEEHRRRIAEPSDSRTVS